MERKILIIHFFSFVLGRRNIFFCEMEEFYFNFTFVPVKQSLEGVFLAEVLCTVYSYVYINTHIVSWW